MTEANVAPSNQRRARWTSAAVLAPGAAALFGATVTWAAATTAATSQQPAVNTSAVTPTSATHHAGLSAQARHWRVVAAHRTRMRHDLTRQLGAVQARIIRLHAADKRLAARLAAQAAAAAAAAGSASSGGYPAPAPVANQPVGPAPVVAPAPVYVPPAPVAAPAAPPPVQAVTGGSGHP